MKRRLLHLGGLGVVAALTAPAAGQDADKRCKVVAIDPGIERLAPP